MSIFRGLRHSKGKEETSIYRAMKQSIFILVALWGLIGSFVPSDRVDSENTSLQTQAERATEIAIEVK